MTMSAHGCIVLADRNYGMLEGLHRLLSSMFETVVMVSDDVSLLAAAPRLQPEAVVVDLSIAHKQSLQWLHRLHVCLPKTHLLVLCDQGEPSVRQAALEAGADGFVLKREASRDLLPAMDAIIHGKQYGMPDAD